MRMMRRNSVLRWGALAAAGLLPGCGYFGGSQPAAPPHTPPEAHPVAQVSPADAAVAGMVDAVGPSRDEAQIDLKFSIRDRPRVGQDDEIDYALVPDAPGLETVRLVFNSLNGLTVVNHGPALAAIKPAPGVPILGSVTVRPAGPGLFTLTVTVALKSPDRSVVWLFTIPVIVGEGPAETAASQP